MRWLVVLATAGGCVGLPAAAAEPVPPRAAAPSGIDQPDPRGPSGRVVIPGYRFARVEGPAGGRTRPGPTLVLAQSGRAPAAPVASLSVPQVTQAGAAFPIHPPPVLAQPASPAGSPGGGVAAGHRAVPDRTPVLGSPPQPAAIPAAPPRPLVVPAVRPPVSPGPAIPYAPTRWSTWRE
jgi:hypothetical protein